MTHANNDDAAERQALRELVGESSIVSIDEAKGNPRFALPLEFHALWRSQDGAVPHQEAFKPGLIEPALMPKLAIMDVLDGGADYRWRFYGTVHVDHFGADLTGTTCSQIETANPATGIIRTLYNVVMKRQDAVFFLLNYLSQDHVIKRATGVMMPLSDDAGETTRLIGVMDWFSA